jgi:hypothetical protein
MQKDRSRGPILILESISLSSSQADSTCATSTVLIVRMYIPSGISSCSDLRIVTPFKRF